MSLFNVDPAKDAARYRSDVHYRLYQVPDGEAVVICVQDFDYYDYDATRFISYDAYDDEASAEQALDGFKAQLWRLLGINPWIARY